MYCSVWILILFSSFLINDSYSTSPVKARVESCPGCQLNRLPEVKQFIYDDIPKYENVEFKKISGAPPELVFLDESDQEIERIDLRNLNRKECNELLIKREFNLIKDNNEL